MGKEQLIAAVVAAVGPKAVDVVSGKLSRRSEKKLEKRCKEALGLLFLDEFVNQPEKRGPANVKEDMHDARVAGLRFIVGARVKKFLDPPYYEVRVVNDQLTGDQPYHTRRFVYYPKTRRVVWK